MSPEAIARGVATRRIRRRARMWHDWQFPDPAATGFASYADAAEKQLREAAAPRLYFNARPALTKADLGALVEEAHERTVRNLRDQLRALHKAEPYMRNYHREQVIKWLGNLRRWPEAETALATVSAELQEYDL
jgi:hypothetical protein